jgi:ribose 1,5-bisphosphokinase PhnN
VLVAGPSGAGKDTLLRLAQAACSDNRDIIFPRRVATREASAAENNDQMSAEAFHQARMHPASWRQARGLARCAGDEDRTRSGDLHLTFTRVVWKFLDARRAK